MKTYPLHEIAGYRFRHSDRIGTGFSSQVFKATSDHASPVAIKIIHTSHSSSLKNLLLKQETEAIQNLTHQNIVTCHQIIECEQQTFIITELCQFDLSALIRRRGGRLLEDQAMPMFQDILNGISHIVHHGYLHRDIKPANVFIKNSIPKIADFGFTCKNRPEGVFEHMSIGTPFYMSPEAICDNHYTEKNEVWALGVLLYEMLHGKVPWHSKSQHELKHEIKAPEIHFFHWISPATKSLIERCLEPNPFYRLSLQELQSQLGTTHKSQLKESFTTCASRSTNKRKHRKSTGLLKFIQMIHELVCKQGQNEFQRPLLQEIGARQAGHSTIYFCTQLKAEIRRQAKLIRWEDMVEQECDKLILVDYLATLHQLLKLQREGELQKRVRVQRLCEGKVVKLQAIHMRLIKEKLQRLSFLTSSIDTY